DDADQHDAVDAPVALDDLVRDPGERAPDLVGVHDGGFEGDTHVRRRSRRAMRTWRPLRAWRKYAALSSESTSGAISSTRVSGCMSTAYLRILASEPLSIRYTPFTAL